MDKKRLTLVVAILVVLAGVGYYAWSKNEDIAGPASEEAALEEGGSFLDNFFEKLKLGEEKQANLKKYEDAKGILSITYPSSWVVRPDQGRLLTGANFTPAELIAKYAPEEQQFIKGLVVGAGEASETPEDYFKKITAGASTGQTESANLTINGYPAYRVKGSINGTDYVVYVLTHNNRVVYFNYRTKEGEQAHQNDIQKAVDFGPYVADFEAAIHSIKFSN